MPTTQFPSSFSSTTPFNSSFSSFPPSTTRSTTGFPTSTIIQVVTISGTQPAVTPSQSSSKSSGGRLSNGAIVGIVLGASLALITLAAFVIWLCICLRRRRHTQRRPQANTYRNVGEKAAFAPGHRPFSDTPLLYEDSRYPEKEGHGQRARDAASTVYTWLQRQPSKYSVVSLYPDRAESRQDVERPSALMEEAESPLSPPPQKSTMPNLPPLAIPVYFPPKRSSEVLSNVGSRSDIEAAPETALSDASSETESIYSQASASTARLQSLPSLQKSTVSVVPVVSSIPEDHPLPAASSPKRMLSDNEAGPSSIVHSPLSAATPTSARTLPQFGLQLPLADEPEPTIERGNTRTVAQLLFTRAKRQAAKSKGGAALNRENTTASKISHIERSNSIEEFAAPSPVGEEPEPEPEPRPPARLVPLSLTPGRKTSSPPPASSLFDVDMPVSAGLDRVSS